MKLKEQKNTKSICLIPRSDFQSFFKVLTQISPFFATFGWNILVMKNALGGPWGKSFPSANFILKKPPAYGVLAEIRNQKNIINNGINQQFISSFSITKC